MDYDYLTTSILTSLTITLLGIFNNKILEICKSILNNTCIILTKFINKFYKFENIYTIKHFTNITPNGHKIEIEENSCNNIIITAIKLYLSHKTYDIYKNNNQLNMFYTTNFNHITDSKQNRTKQMYSNATMYCEPEYYEYDNMKFYFHSNSNIQNDIIIQNMYVNIHSKIRDLEYIKNFINECKEYYLEQRYKDIDTINAIYARNTTIANIYTFKTDVVFDKLFFDEKNEIIELLNEHKAGIRKKLGILLYGPPGTAKSSIIKASANHLKYDVVILKLNQINNIDDLLGIFHGKQFATTLVDTRKKIIIIEDIDCDTDISHNRKLAKQKVVVPDELTKTSIRNTLSLSDLLNVSQGLLEIECIYFFTTNDINVLDPALIRPGRIDYKLCLDKLSKNSMRNMIQYKYPDAIIDEKYIKPDFITGSTLEMYINSSKNDINKLYDYIHKHH